MTGNLFLVVFFRGSFYAGGIFYEIPVIFFEVRLGRVSIFLRAIRAPVLFVGVSGAPVSFPHEKVLPVPHPR
ncbi:MAG TPA: hypothetical protein O0X39_08205 [Methanocorpusculum sp.]|nr:hypothetical protein [Methanocorpusculum sp.]